MLVMGVLGKPFLDIPCRHTFFTGLHIVQDIFFLQVRLLATSFKFLAGYPGGIYIPHQLSILNSDTNKIAHIQSSSFNQAGQPLSWSGRLPLYDLMNKPSLILTLCPGPSHRSVRRELSSPVEHRIFSAGHQKRCVLCPGNGRRVHG